MLLVGPLPLLTPWVVVLWLIQAADREEAQKWVEVSGSGSGSRVAPCPREGRTVGRSTWPPLAAPRGDGGWAAMTNKHSNSSPPSYLVSPGCPMPTVPMGWNGVAVAVTCMMARQVLNQLKIGGSPEVQSTRQEVSPAKQVQR